jgi:hypothetical protein
LHAAGHGLHAWKHGLCAIQLQLADSCTIRRADCDTNSDPDHVTYKVTNDVAHHNTDRFANYDGTHTITDHVVSHCVTLVVAHNVTNNITNRVTHDITIHVSHSVTNNLTNDITNHVTNVVTNHGPHDIPNHVADRVPHGRAKCQPHSSTNCGPHR